MLSFYGDQLPFNLVYSVPVSVNDGLVLGNVCHMHLMNSSVHRHCSLTYLSGSLFSLSGLNERWSTTNAKRWPINKYFSLIHTKDAIDHLNLGLSKMNLTTLCEEQTQFLYI